MIETNICALATDLAKQNNMAMTELFKKYKVQINFYTFC